MLIRIQKLAVIILVIAMVTSAVALGVKYERQYKANQATFQRELKIEQDKQKRESQEQDKLQEEKIEQQKKDLEGQIEALKQQSAAKKAQTLAAAAKAAQSVATQAVAHAQAAPATSGSEAASKTFIYNRESGNVACKINGGAVNCNYVGPLACGIGQALPCSKLTSVCSLADYACQDVFFTNYMRARYGTWQAAEAYWKCIGKCTNKYGTVQKNSTWW